MRRTRGRGIEVDSLEEFDRRIRAGARSLRGWRISGIELTDRDAVLDLLDVGGALFLGCGLGAASTTRLLARGAIVLPRLDGMPVDVHRDRLYRPEELYDAAPYAASLDARVFAWSQTVHDEQASLAKALHDHALDDALADWVDDRRLVGVMGGHGLRRDSVEYAAAAALGLGLGRRHVVATGGGPGAMEAANLGGYLSGLDSAGAALDEALDLLGRVPSYHPSVDDWAAGGFEILRRHSSGSDTLGIPTWRYGHEPPNVLATAIAKYVRNALREAVLLEVCHAGIVFLTGAAGTIQEIFQDACENYYADESSVAPMVLVGTAYWTEELPAWPLLKRLARGGPMEQHVHLVADVHEAVAVFDDAT